MTKRNDKQLDYGIYGKVPPQAKDLEESVLGSCMLEDVFHEVSAILKPEAFYVTAHEEIFKAMAAIASSNLKIDMLTVVSQLRETGQLEAVGGPYYISKLISTVTSTANVLTHARLIAQKYMLREIIRVSGESITAAYEEGADAFEVLDTAESEFQAINDHLSFGDMLTSERVLIDAISHIEHNRELFNEHGCIPVTGVPSGIENLDSVTLGWQPGDLIIIGARASVGKTAFALKLARSASAYFKQQHTQRKEKLKKVAVFSLEMKAARLMVRILSRETRLPMQQLKSGALTDDDMKIFYKRGVDVLSKEGILFDDQTGLTTRKLISKTKKLARKGELGMIVIDYLQLMTPASNGRGNREQDISTISRDLKNLAQEFNIPIIALSQLSREVEKRPSGIPVLSDLRESGAIEQDADIVGFLYGYSEGAIAEDANLKNRRFFKIAKQRDGMLDTIELSADLSIQEFETLRNEYQPPSGNFRPVSSQESKEARLYIQKDLTDETPF